MEIKKSPKADLESKKLTFTLIGLVVTLFIVWRVFEYKSYDKQTIDDLQRTVEVIEEEMVEITKQEQPKVQPPQPKPQVTQIQVVEDDVEVEDDIDINLKAVLYITEKYGMQPKIRSILTIGSASAHTGSEFPEYCASKGGILAYTKNAALRAAQYGATCNSLDPGGVLTPLNECVMNNPVLWQQIMDETPLKKWATPEEIAEWAYFLTVVNRFCTGQSILVDGGEAINYHFVWHE